MKLQSVFADVARRDWDTGVEANVRFAVVGLGGYARNVSLPAIQSSDYCEVGAVVSGDPGKARDVATEYDATALDYDEYEAGAATDAYDAAYVATPNRLHLPHAGTAAGHGKHVLCEKPLEATPRRASRLVDACRDADVRLMTAYRMQADPVVRRLREFVRAGGVGEPIRATGDFTTPVLSGSRGPDQWRLDADLAGGGALFDVGVYPLNTTRFVCAADPVAVWGTTRSTAPAFEEVDEHVDFGVEFDGFVGEFSASFSGFRNAQLAIHGSDGRIEVGSAFGPNADREVTVETDAGRLSFAGLGADETREEFDYFAHAVRRGVDIEPDGVDGLTDVRAMAAAYESDAGGTRVSLAAE